MKCKQVFFLKHTNCDLQLTTNNFKVLGSKCVISNLNIKGCSTTNIKERISRRENKD